MAEDTASAEAQAALLARAATGDGQAAQALARDLGPRLLAQATRMLGDRAEAEDVAQETLLRLWRMAPNWDAQGGAKVSTWCHGVARNLCIDRMRRHGGARAMAGLDEIDTPADPSPGAEAQLQDRARAAALHQALRSLPDRQRQALVLRHIEGQTNPQIADAIGGSVEAVESLLSRGKRALKGLLAPRRAELGFEDDQT